jgi:WD40 repeat protein
MQVLTSADGIVTELAFAPNGQALAATVSGQVPFLWDIPATTAPKALAEYRAFGKSTTDTLTFSPDSSVVGWVVNHQRWEYERDTGEEREVQLVEGDEMVNSQALSGPDGHLIIRTVDPQVGFRIRCFIPDGGGSWEERWVVGPDEITRGVLIASGGERFCNWEEFLAKDRPPKLVLRSSMTGMVRESTKVPTGIVYGLTAKSDGSEVVAFKDSALVVWQPGTKPQLLRTGTRTHFRAVRYHPTGKYLFAANNDASIRVFDTSSWSIVKEYTWNIGKLSSVAVSPDGTLAAAGGEHGQVVVWDLDL